jgi:two-component system chemotaxis response regulator CheB
MAVHGGPARDIIVVGASAGGVEALPVVLRGLPPDLQAAVFIVLHIPPYHVSMLPRILSAAAPVPVTHPSDGEEIRHGRIYVAPPNRHLEISHDRIRLSGSARENGHRPAIDVTFRSAAEAYGPRVIGVVLTGMLDDGTMGLIDIKRRGGLAVVQDPATAVYPSMPTSAVRNVSVDHMVPLSEMGPLLARLITQPIPETLPASASETDPAGEVSAMTCPECHGTLWEHRTAGRHVRYACRVGHSYTEAALATNVAQEVEDALWIALRVLEENRDLSRRIARRAVQGPNGAMARRFEQKAREAEEQMAVIQRLIHERTSQPIEEPIES